MDPSELHPSPEIARILERRRFLKNAAAGTLLVALGGGSYVVAAADDPRAKTPRPDGRPRLPPGQRIIDALKPIGGDPGDVNPANFHLHVHGEVENPVTLDFAKLLALPQTDLTCDVHCVTGWTMFDATWRGVQVAELAKLVRVKSTARYVIFEAANSYTANVRLSEALAPSVLVAHQHGGKSLSRPHGPPARALVPDLYFWKSAKWVRGITMQRSDRPGFWEQNGYHMYGDPWREQRYSSD